MEEVSGPIIAIALVLGAVFVPTAFISGLTGQFYRQFALTIAISTVISAFNSLTLSPALASRLLRAHGAPRDGVQRVDRPAVRLVLPRLQPRVQARIVHLRRRGLQRAARRRRSRSSLYVGLIGLTGVGFRQGAAGFHPGAGQGLPRGVRAVAGRRDARSHGARHPPDVVDSRWRIQGVANSVAFPGLSINGFVNAPNTGIAFVTLKPSDERARERGLDANSIVGGSEPALRRDSGRVTSPSSRRRPCRASAPSGGFKLYVEDRAGLGFEELYQQVQNAAMAGQQVPSLAGLFSSFQVSVPQIDVHVDRERVKTYGIPLTDVFDTLQVYLGSLYANDFNRFGRTYQVNVQAESSFRMQPEQIARLKTRNARRRDGAARIGRCTSAAATDPIR